MKFEDYKELLLEKYEKEGFLEFDDLKNKQITKEQFKEIWDWIVENKIEILEDFQAYARRLPTKSAKVTFCYYAFICIFLGRHIDIKKYDRALTTKQKGVVDYYLKTECTKSELKYARTKFGLDDGEIILNQNKLYEKLHYHSLNAFDKDSRNVFAIMKSDHKFHYCLVNMLGAIYDALYIKKYDFDEDPASYDCTRVGFRPYRDEKNPCGGPYLFQWSDGDKQVGWISPDLKSGNWVTCCSDGTWYFGTFNRNKASTAIRFSDNTLSFLMEYSNVGEHGIKYVFELGKSTRIERYEKGKLQSTTELDFVIDADLTNLFGLGELTEKPVEKFVDSKGNLVFSSRTDKTQSPCFKVLKHNGNSMIGHAEEKGFMKTTLTHNGWNDGFVYQNVCEGKPIEKGPEIIVDKYGFPPRIIFNFYNKENHKCAFFYCPTEMSYELMFYEFSDDKKEPINSANLSDPFFKKALVKDNPIDIEDPQEALNKLIGLASVKTQIERLKAILKKDKNRANTINLNMVFSGNPGTGKTVVARLLGSILYKEGILPTNNFIEVDRSMIVGKYVGQTENIVKNLIDKAKGGVIFIDEAYSLYSRGDDGDDYGQRALDTFVKAMEDYRGQICFIFAGYKYPMQRMMEMNQGFRSRVNRYIEFPNYSVEELKEIGIKMAKDNKYELSDGVIEEIVSILEPRLSDPDFANAREVRNVLETLYEIQAVRTFEEQDNFVITLEDVKEYEKDIQYKPVEKKQTITIDKSVIERNRSFMKGVAIDKKHMQEASVCIKVYEDNRLIGEGSGFFITSDGLIGTCAHVVKDAETIKVSVNIFTSKEEQISKIYEAVLVGLNKETDAAIIKIANPDKEFAYYRLADKNFRPALLNEIAMAGYPLGGETFSAISMNEGKIQSYNKDPLSKRNLERIYLDLTGHPGNSGSGVIDVESGECVGIFTGAFIEKSSYPPREIKYANPIDYLWDLIDDLSTNK